MAFGMPVNGVAGHASPKCVDADPVALCPTDRAHLPQLTVYRGQRRRSRQHEGLVHEFSVGSCDLRKHSHMTAIRGALSVEPCRLSRD